MDKAPVSDAGDCEFKSRLGRYREREMEAYKKGECRVLPSFVLSLSCFGFLFCGANRNYFI